MTKFKLFLNIDKEEAWINSIITQGYRLKNVSWGQYVFEELPPGANVENEVSETAQAENPHSEGRNTEPFLPLVRMDFRIFSKKEDFIDYLTLFEDYGWHHVAGKKSEGNFFRFPFQSSSLPPDFQQLADDVCPVSAAVYHILEQFSFSFSLRVERFLLHAGAVGTERL